MSRPRDYTNIGILALCEAIFMTTALVNFGIAGLAAGQMLTHRDYATVPLAMIPVVSMLTAIPASYTMQRIGRRNGFLLGVLAGIGSGVLCAYAILANNFALFLAGAVLIGVYQAFATYYRFAVADHADDGLRGQAVALVLAGGLLAAILGPSVVSVSETMFAPVMFVGSYALITVINLVAFALLACLRLPDAPRVQRPTKGRFTLAPIFSDRRIVLAMLSCGLGNATMMLLMTATPLAMVACGFGTGTTGLVLSAHVAGMFAPFLVSGHLTRLVGAERMVGAGLLVMVLASGIAASGTSEAHFGLALVASGLGWNFMYVGGSTMLAGLGTADDRALIQGLNEVLGFAMTAAGALSAGLIYANAGWWHVAGAAAVFSLGLLLTFALLRPGRGRGVRATDRLGDVR